MTLGRDRALRNVAAVQFRGDAAGSVELAAPSASTATAALVLPGADAAERSTLVNDGAGVLEWAPLRKGGVTSEGGKAFEIPRMRDDTGGVLEGSGLFAHTRAGGVTTLSVGSEGSPSLAGGIDEKTQEPVAQVRANDVLLEGTSYSSAAKLQFQSEGGEILGVQKLQFADGKYPVLNVLVPPSDEVAPVDLYLPSAWETSAGPWLLYQSRCAADDDGLQLSCLRPPRAEDPRTYRLTVTRGVAAWTLDQA